jgi:hypothetical protein
MKANFQLNRKLTRKNGIDVRLINVYKKQKGYGRQAVYVSFNEYHFGKIKDLYICDVFPNIDEHFNNYDESDARAASHEKLIVDKFFEEIIEYIESIEEDEEE